MPVNKDIWKDVTFNFEGSENDNIVQSILKGIPSSPGMAFGRAHIIKPESIVIPSHFIKDEAIPNEIIRFETAIKELIKELIAVMKKVKEDSKSIAAIIETNLAILTDSSFIDAIKSRISKGVAAENSVIQEFDVNIRYIKKAKDPILKERAYDLEQIKERLIAVLRNRCIIYAVQKNAVIVAQSLSPTDIVNFKDAGAIGFITEIGGIASHSSILARSYEIPEVIAVKNAIDEIENNAKLIIDGYTGRVIVYPSKNSVSVYIEKKQREEENKKRLGEFAKLPAETLDGKQILLLSNIDFPNEVKATVINGAEGIGLVRTENLIIADNYIPEEETQYKWYQSIAQRVYPNPVTIRAFDIGSDKYSEGMPKHENNPALGLRGIRFLLLRDDLFRTQIRAILRVSKNKNVRLMLPMVTCLSEIQKSIVIINECKEQLLKEDIPFDNYLPIGIMIETPAAAIMAERLSGYCDFFSIGTNDLTQYTLAVDRTNELVSPIYDSFHPSILELIRITANAAAKAKIPVSVCGEIAGHSAATSLLIGLGVTELSVAAPVLLELKKKIREINFRDAKKMAENIMNSTEYDELRQKISLLND